MVYTTLCLSGGGINGLNILGSLKYLIDTKIVKLQNIDTFVGTSIGSVISLLLSIGYNINELIRIIYKIDFEKLDIDYDIDYFIEHLGVDNGSRIIAIIQSLLYNKTKYYDMTFKKHYELTNKKIKFISVNFNTKKEELFSVDTTPNVSIILAVRMSISIPLIFTPVYYNNNIYVDGALLNNFGLQYCEKDITIGICLSYNINYKNINVMNYIFGLLSIFSDNVTINKNLANHEAIVKLNIDWDNMVNFSPNKSLKKDLLKEGYKYTKKECDKNLELFSVKFVNKILDNVIKEFSSI
jgi:NTE family protein